MRRGLEEEKRDGLRVVTKQKEMEDLRGKGGGRLKHRTIDGDVPLCLRNNVRIATTTATAKERRAKKRKAEAALRAKRSIAS